MINANSATPFGEAVCHGPTSTDQTWPEAALDSYDGWPPADGLNHGDRFCLIALSNGTYALLGMQHVRYNTWRAVEFRLPAKKDDNGGGLFPGGGDDDDDGGIGPLF
jgi:hypothetical protein